MRTLKIYCSPNFQVHNPLLSTLVTMLNNRPLDVIPPDYLKFCIIWPTRYSILLQMIALWMPEYSSRATRLIILLSFKHLNLETVVDAVTCYPDPYPPTFRTEWFICRAAGHVDKWQLLTIFPPTPTLSPVPAQPHSMAGQCRGRKARLFSSIQDHSEGSSLFQSSLWVGRLWCDCFNLSLCPPLFPSFLHEDLCWKLLPINSMHTSLHLTVCFLGPINVTSTPVYQYLWKECKVQCSQTNR